MDFYLIDSGELLKVFEYDVISVIFQEVDFGSICQCVLEREKIRSKKIYWKIFEVIYKKMKVYFW